MALAPHETLEILRRLDAIDKRLDSVEGTMEKLDERFRAVEFEVAETRGLRGVEGRMTQPPTRWTMAGLVFAIFGSSLVLLRFAGP
ncbi:MAG: hypothetical protein HQL40_20225 [Alphaproteobacteria bacterium]|nr:hypothetical protein [Alphaproteobacteria bacterium]